LSPAGGLLVSEQLGVVKAQMQTVTLHALRKAAPPKLEKNCPFEAMQFIWNCISADAGILAE
jgi:hypothetical protein